MHDDLTEDAFLGARVTLLQPRHGPRAGLDAVFLAAACPVDPSAAARCLDAGAGVGTVSMCLAHRAPKAVITGVEIDAQLAAIFTRNALANGVESRVSVIEGDLTQPFKLLEEKRLRANSFDHVLSNPPFFTSGSVRAPLNTAVERAHVSQEGELDLWFRFFAACAAPKGTLTVIHHAQALPDLLKAADGRFGGLCIFPLFPREGAPAIRVLIQGEKGSRAPISIQSGMILHDASGAFTPEAKAILRDGASLSLT